MDCAASIPPRCQRPATVSFQERSQDQLSSSCGLPCIPETTQAACATAHTAEFNARRPLSVSSPGQNKSISRSRRCGRSGKVKRKPANRRVPGRGPTKSVRYYVKLGWRLQTNGQHGHPPGQTQLENQLLENHLLALTQPGIAARAQNFNLKRKLVQRPGFHSIQDLQLSCRGPTKPAVRSRRANVRSIREKDGPNQHRSLSAR